LIGKEIKKKLKDEKERKITQEKIRKLKKKWQKKKQINGVKIVYCNTIQKDI